MSDDHAGLIDTHMELLPPARATVSMFRSSPFALADNRQARAVDDEMKACAPWNAPKRQVEVLATTGQRRVIRRPKVEPHQHEERREKALGLTERQMEEKTQRQGGFDREVRVLPLRAPRARSVRFPGGDGRRGQPDGDIASTDQGAIIGGSVLNTVLLLVCGMDSRLHPSSLNCRLETSHQIRAPTPGHYDVTALIGEGGMGQVYQATDTQLNRQVALKILPEAFATDPDRLARFQREAQVLASLNHPGIAAIYGIEEAEGTRALVLELVEGPTLADRITQGPIPIDEALPIAKQIAEAVEAAHEAGVIHRDLKPANVKVKEDGTVKVLDFGLAKALDPSPTGDPSQSPTLTAAANQMGVIMGTAAYMSPEQTAGQTADKRSDIWSFGVVLFEMLTGQRVFTGETVSHILGAVLQIDPKWDALPVPTPQPLRKLLRRCLEKDQKRRGAGRRCPRRPRRGTHGSADR